MGRKSATFISMRGGEASRSNLLRNRKAKSKSQDRLKIFTRKFIPGNRWISIPAQIKEFESPATWQLVPKEPIYAQVQSSRVLQQNRFGKGLASYLEKVLDKHHSKPANFRQSRGE